jgi:hypothetical protein
MDEFLRRAGRGGSQVEAREGQENPFFGFHKKQKIFAIEKPGRFGAYWKHGSGRSVAW